MGNVFASLIRFWRSSAEATQASKRETRTESTMAAQGGQEEIGLLMMEGAAPIADRKEDSSLRWNALRAERAQ